MIFKIYNTFYNGIEIKASKASIKCTTLEKHFSKPCERFFEEDFKKWSNIF